MRTLRDRLRRRDDDGFTIAEVMVALVIFALMSTGSIFATISMLQITRDARNRQVAANLAAQEIDAVRAISDPTTVVDRSFDPSPQNGTAFHVNRSVSWSALPVSDQDGQTCGQGQQRTVADVTVTVTWQGMRAQTSPVVSNTLLTVQDLNPDRGTGSVNATVLDGSGVGVAGVRVQAGHVSGITDARGCVILLHVQTGTMDVTASKPGYVDQNGIAAPAKSTAVSGGNAVDVSFQLGWATHVSVHSAAGYVESYGTSPYGLRPGYSGNQVRAFAALPVTFTNSNIDNLKTVLPSSSTMVGTVDLFPFASGYSVFAGDCDQSDPRYWYPGGQADVTPFATPAGGQATAYVPMGVVLLSDLGAAVVLTATPVGQTGCAASQYTFGSADGYTIAGPAAIALPYGSWKLSYDAGHGQVDVPDSSLTPLTLPSYSDRGLPEVQTTLSGAVVTSRPVVP